MEIKVYRVETGDEACDLCTGLAQRYYVEVPPPLPFHKGCDCTLVEVDPSQTDCRLEFRHFNESSTVELIRRTVYLRACESDDAETETFTLDPSDEDDLWGEWKDFVEENTAGFPDDGDTSFTVEVAAGHRAEVEFEISRVTNHYEADGFVVCDLPDGTKWSKPFGAFTGSATRDLSMEVVDERAGRCYHIQKDIPWHRVG